MTKPTSATRPATIGPVVRSLRSAVLALPVKVGYVYGPRLLSALRRRWVLMRNPHAEIRFGRGNHLGPGFSLHMPEGGTFITGDWVEFRRNFRAELGPNGRIEIGSCARMTYDVVIQCDTTIVIGERAVIAQGSLITDGNHRFRDVMRPILDQGYDRRPLHIGDDVLVHAKCTVVNDIGAHSVIGANAVVSRPVPARCLAAGVPARVVEHLGPGGEEPHGASAFPDAPAGTLDHRAQPMSNSERSGLRG